MMVRGRGEKTCNNFVLENNVLKLGRIMVHNWGV
jgi:hypothetical protein